MVLLLSLSSNEQTRRGFYTAFRAAFVQTLILLSSLVFAYNKTASAVDLVTPASARLFWLLVCLGSAGWFLRSAKRNRWGNLSRRVNHLFRLRGIDQQRRILIYAGVVLIVLPLLALAVYVPPNNYDSHQYHLSRILYWLANRNLDRSPTRHVQQLYHNVFAEYLVLPTFLLTGFDLFANLVQFTAMLGSALAVSLLGPLV